MGLGYAVLAAAATAQGGGSAAEVAERARAGALASATYVYVDTLEYLRRGGGSGRAGRGRLRAGGEAAPAPRGRRLEPLERVRTSSRALERLEEIVVAEAGEREVDLAVHHLAAEQRPARSPSACGNACPHRVAWWSRGRGVVGAHVGPAWSPWWSRRSTSRIGPPPQPAVVVPPSTAGGQAPLRGFRPPSVARHEAYMDEVRSAGVHPSRRTTPARRRRRRAGRRVRGAGRSGAGRPLSLLRERAGTACRWPGGRAGRWRPGRHWLPWSSRSPAVLGAGARIWWVRARADPVVVQPVVAAAAAPRVFRRCAGPAAPVSVPAVCPRPRDRWGSRGCRRRGRGRRRRPGAASGAGPASGGIPRGGRDRRRGRGDQGRPTSCG
jgi:hypothetical protein